MVNRITQYLDTVSEVCKHLNKDEILTIYQIIRQAADADGKIYICGNGGSASTASHFQSDLNHAFSISCNKMPAVCLTDNLAALTATANDISYDYVFCHPLKFLLQENDIVVTISGSGNSENVINAANIARAKGNKVISLVGFDGGKLKSISDYSFHVRVNNMQITEDLHLMFCHIVSSMIREGIE